jgi:nitroreductase
MNVIEALNARYTCRAFKPIQVDKEVLLKILQAANQSPSWGNTQPWEIFVASGAALDRLRKSCVDSFVKGVPQAPELGMVEKWPAPLKARYTEVSRERIANAGIDPKDMKAIGKYVAQGFGFWGAPAVIFLCRDRSLTQWSLFDLGLVAEGIMISAEQMDLNTAVAVQCASYPNLIRAELSIPEDLEIVIGIAIGFGDPDHVENRIRASRRAIEDVVRFKDA